MPPFRNFLARKSGTLNGGEVDRLPDSNNQLAEDGHRSTPLSIRKSHETEPLEYKLSVVDVNGEYLPPSPPEKESFWRKYPGVSRPSSHHRNLVDENEPFSISRESFDSYRRSFDISARSPVSYTDALPSRTSLDSRFSRLTSPSGPRPFEKQPQTTEEDCFEDVGLDDDDNNNNNNNNNSAKPKKRGLFPDLAISPATPRQVVPSPHRTWDSISPAENEAKAIPDRNWEQ
ncbi:hypothetical protein ARAM_006024 [Aspergillus rambellii]|uniref:Uncharacterized protein n=1 Tax=Aspergillus rambellii TaxID=308745 RepID=A0A0F8WQU3_9EURO|nr:hypothetical protein ARAM_006024 [Aspergillus rambellii]